ncbi:hypothetical protein BsWGS_21797 [Bradybaena similaris]
MYSSCVNLPDCPTDKTLQIALIVAGLSTTTTAALLQVPGSDQISVIMMPLPFHDTFHISSHLSHFTTPLTFDSLMELVLLYCYFFPCCLHNLSVFLCIRSLFCHVPSI